jgi:excinuclease ABC subunit C
VPGLGPARRKRLLKEFGSVKRLREQSPETLTGLGWLPTAVGEALYAALHGEVLPAPAMGSGSTDGPDLPSLAP